MEASDNKNNNDDPFLLQTILDRPFGLWCIWLLGTLAWVFLVFGVMLDEIGAANYTVEGSANLEDDEYTCTCGIYTFDCTGSGFQETDYTDNNADEETVVADQANAGTTWLALNIIAIIFSIICCIGYGKDYLDGEYDSIKPSSCWDGCPAPCEPCGLSTIGMCITVFWTIIALLGYAANETCSDDKFWDLFQGGEIKDFVPYGGISIALSIMSIIFFLATFGLILFEIKVFGGLPTGEAKEGIKWQKEAVGVPQELRDKANKPPPPKWQPTGKPPDSNLFNPTNNVTNSTTNNTSKPPAGLPKAPPTYSSQSNNNNNNTTTETNPFKKQAKWGVKSTTASPIAGSKPSGPPPVPSRPKGPPPVPK